MSGTESQKVIAERKVQYAARLEKLLEEYPKIFLVGCDNVGSKQMQKIRNSILGKAVILMGKNTMIRRVIKLQISKNPKLEELLPHVAKNVGFVFTKGDLSEVKKLLSQNKVAAAAKAGVLSPNDVVIPAGNTGLEPTQTSFLQALGIASKISKGTVEITQDVKILSKGQKVGLSEATLLSKLNIMPFSYGLDVKVVYDNGTVYDPSILDITSEEILAKFRSGVTNVACVSLATGVPTLASLPHTISNGFKNILAIALETSYSFPMADKFKNASAAAPAATSAPVAAAVEEAAPAAAAPASESDEDMGLDLFG